MVALCLSGSVLVLTFWPAVRDDHPKVIIAIMSAIALLNILLAVGCKVTTPFYDHYTAFISFYRENQYQTSKDMENKSVLVKYNPQCSLTCFFGKLHLH